MIPNLSISSLFCGCPFLWPGDGDAQYRNQPRQQNLLFAASCDSRHFRQNNTVDPHNLPVTKDGTSSTCRTAEEVDDIVSMRNLFRKSISRNKQDVDVQSDDIERKGVRIITLFSKKNKKNKKSCKTDPSFSSEESTVPPLEAAVVDVTPAVEETTSNDEINPESTDHTVTLVDSDVSSDTASVEATPLSVEKANIVVAEEQEPADEPACYLVYEPGSSGRLVEYYCVTAVVEDAVVGKWVNKGGKKIAAFKFTCNAGRNVLIGSCSAGVQGRKNYCNGWCQFVRSCNAMQGQVTIFEVGEGVKAMPVDVYLYYDRRNHQTAKLEPGSPLTTENLVAVACLPRSSPFFATNDTVDVMKWLQDARVHGYSTKI
jgi:hypothetical protein